MSSVYIDLCPIASGICGSSYSQSDGTYRLLVPAGTWRVSAEKYGFPVPPAQTVTVPPARTNVDFTISSAPTPVQYTITGTVRDVNGNPVDGTVVTASTSCCGQSTATTSPTGRYTLTVSRGGTYLVEAGGVRRLATVPPNTIGVDLTVPRQYAIGGTVRDAGGQPVAQAHVKTTVAGKTVESVTDATGHYTFASGPAPTGSRYLSLANPHRRRGRSPCRRPTRDRLHLAVRLPRCRRGAQQRWPACRIRRSPGDRLIRGDCCHRGGLCLAAPMTYS